MKKTNLLLLLIFANVFAYSQSPVKAYLTATFLNKNVYKTRVPINDAKLIYKDKNRLNGEPMKVRSVTIAPPDGGFIRYKEVRVEGDFSYIRILPGCLLVNDSIKKVDGQQG